MYPDQICTICIADLHGSVNCYENYINCYVNCVIMGYHGLSILDAMQSNWHWNH